MVPCARQRFSPILWSLCFFISACSSQTQYAPVLDGWKQPISKQGYHRVSPGETLYSIAWQYGLDYRDLVTINHLVSPYVLHSGEALALSAPSTPENGSALTRKRLKTQKINLPSKRYIPIKANPHSAFHSPVAGSWQWPARGTLVKDYQTGAMGNKGLDIGGVLGAPIKAAAPGTIVYSGNGIRGYGNLLIIKHDEHYLSAYGHNQHILVHEGQGVKQGETIATMGRNEKGLPLLHFEIRRMGKPVNPHDYLSRAH